MRHADFGVVLLQARQRGAVAVPIIFAQPAGGFGRERASRRAR